MKYEPRAADGTSINCGLPVSDDIEVNQYDVPFVPTDYAVVDSMLSAAGAGKNDIVYDLGCGDGRIVIAAAKKYGVKKAVGIDLDPMMPAAKMPPIPMFRGTPPRIGKSRNASTAPNRGQGSSRRSSSEWEGSGS